MIFTDSLDISMVPHAATNEMSNVTIQMFLMT